MLAAMWRCWAICILIGSLGCESLGEFRTGDGEVYRGEIQGVNDPESCPEGIDCSFIRRGFPSGMTLDLTFDPDQQYDMPGTISTSGESCGPTFDDTPLLAIVPLVHDQLSQYDFPGSGRIRNFMFVAQPEAGPLAGRDAMVFISLIRGGSMEVRIIAGPGSVICDPANCAELESGLCDFFGVFTLGKEPL
jgi:hypothetical protein